MILRQFTGLLAASLLVMTEASFGQPAAPPRRPFVEIVHGVPRSDDYRWMETGGAEFESWTREEGEWARNLLDSIPGRAALFAEIQRLDRPAPGISGLQSRAGRWLFDTLLDGASSRNSVYRRGEDGPDVRFSPLDLLPQAGASWSEIGYARTLSPNGRYVVFGTTRSGEAEPAIRVYDFEAGRLLPDVITWPLWADSRGFRPRWLADSSGFFYVRNPAASENMENRERARRGQVFLHRLGTAQADDQAIFGFGITNGIEEEDTLYVEGEPDPRWLAILNRKASGREIWAVDLNSPTREARRLYHSDELVPGFGIRNGKLYTLDSKDSERYRVVSVDVARPAAPVEALPQQEGVLGHLQVSADAVYVVESRLGENRLHVIEDEGVRALDLPSGSVEDVAAGPDGNGLWFEITNWLRPRSGRLVRPGAGEAVSLDESHPQADGAVDTVTELIWAAARDGVQIPYTVVRRANAPRNGRNYALISGYGCFGTINTPFYWPALNAWLDKGGIFVQAAVRGGGELGSSWHRAGSDQAKATSFEDTIDIVRHLIATGWTGPGRVGLTGGSCGGATMGMAALEAPHLIGAAALSAAALDMNRIASATAAGARSIREFGDPETADGSRRIDSLSPYRQLLPGAPRPAFLLMNGATDYTIPLWIGGKFVAAARASAPFGPPVIWRIDWTSGHNIGRDYAAEDADLMAFMFWRLGHPDFQLPARQH